MAQHLTAWQKANALMDTTGVHLERAATDFEALYKDNPNDSGVRRIYFELSRRISAKYPIARPQPTEAPNEDPIHPSSRRGFKTIPKAGGRADTARSCKNWAAFRPTSSFPAANRTARTWWSTSWPEPCRPSNPERRARP